MRFALFAILGLIGTVVASAQEPSDSTPPAYAPFEHMVGSWKGTGVLEKNKLKGWPEKHMWAWKFAKGKPVGMSLETTGDKVLAKAQLGYDAKTETYTLDGTDPDGKKVVFAGKLDDSGLLTMDRLNPPAEVGKERLELALNQNKIRYTMRLFRQEPGSPQYAPILSVNPGKEGESFAAGGAAADLPKCIITGGAGTMTVAYQGKSYAICCTGCRDEFNDNPDKYVKKYLAKLEKGEVAPAAAKPAEEVPVAETKKDSSKPKAMPKDSTPREKPEPATTKTEAKPATDKADPAAKAASLLAQGIALEKAGKSAAALTYYKRVAKEFADTPSAKSANAKIKSLGGK
jgi:YHS domain-containing protein